LNMSTANIPSARRIASIDVMIPHNANPGRT
jgi:hypothetical protein